MLILSTGNTKNRQKPTKTFDKILAEIRQKSENTVELGKKFEKLVLDYFETDRHYRGEFEKIQMWDEWSKKNNVRRPDEGVDLVATLHDGSFCAIQCKCYSDSTDLTYEDISTFLATYRSYKMTRPILVFTGDKINDKANYHLKKHGVSVITSDLLRQTRIDWSGYPRLKSIEQKKLRDYQQKAFDDVMGKFTDADRGKMIMACGTGKTFTSLRIAEKQVADGGLILYLVPSITLIQQSMREWSDNRYSKHEYMAVCSDTTVKDEDGTITELESRVSTDAKTLENYLMNRDHKKTMVIFSTYHSVERVGKAIRSLGEEFDLVFCDEAHRTVQGADESYYSFVHKNSNIPAKKRLYMTATPKVYSEAVVNKARKHEREIIDMADEKTYGKDFHRLTFSDAVHKYEALSDYRVIIAHIPVSDIPKDIQQNSSDDEGLLELERITRMQVIWKAIMEKDPDIEKDFLQRMIVFSNRIKDSKKFAGETDSGDVVSFSKVVDTFKKYEPTKKTATAIHVDASTKSLERKKRLHWLAESNTKPDECRLLTNAKCLSEGVDVPALDGVAFMEPRSSKVDVVQAVGRVMRRFENKRYGYVILPVAVPAGMDPNDTLDKSNVWKVVWQVLNALRSHDNELEIEINQLALKKPDPGGLIAGKIKVMDLGESQTDVDIERLLHTNISIKTLEKVGDHDYFDKYGVKIGEAAVEIEEKVAKKIKDPDIKKIFDSFKSSLNNVVGDSITEKDVKKVIAQHIVLSRIFDTLFDNQFTSMNPISKEFGKIVEKLGLGNQVADLEEFYHKVDAEVQEIGDDREKRQNFIKKIYGNFFVVVDKKGTEKHGIVYTPVEIIDFIINSVEHLLDDNFGKSFKNMGVKVLEPFAGTGTFISRLLESGHFGNNLRAKYEKDITANELILLAHYIATVNIETTYQSLRRGSEYAPFNGMTYVDTLGMNPRHLTHPEKSKKQQKLDSLLPVLDERIRSQRNGKIDVIIGNPPYSAGQKKFSDENKNALYPEIDERIKDTYLKKTNASNVVSIYDSYIRSIRWMSDRINGHGLIGIVTNGSFIRSDTASGMRMSLEEEFNKIIVFDLLGKAGVEGNGRNVFEYAGQSGGSKSPICIMFLVKTHPKTKDEKCMIKYYSIGSKYYSGPDKRNRVKQLKNINGIKKWQVIYPDKYNDWLSHRNSDFEKYVELGNKDVKKGKNGRAIFKIYSSGIKTHRDVWVYNSSKDVLIENMYKHVKYCNSQNPEKPIIDKKQAQWSADLKTSLKKYGKQKFDENKIRTTIYRPFFKQKMYYDRVFNSAMYRIPSFFPKKNTENLVILIPSKVQQQFSVLITDAIPDLHSNGDSQCFPFYIYNNGKSKDNILDSALNEYRNHYKNKNITKKDIFYYVYGILHHRAYKSKFHNNLTRELPHIPMAPDFEKFKDMGKQLADLHLNYETCKRFNLGKPKINIIKFKKLSFASNKKLKNNTKSEKNKSVLQVDGKEMYDNIPDMTYTVNGRTPLEWVMDRYMITHDTDSGITNDPCTDIDLIPLIERAVYVGVESDKLINLLPEEFEPKDWTPKRINLDAHMDVKQFDSTLD